MAVIPPTEIIPPSPRWSKDLYERDGLCSWKAFTGLVSETVDSVSRFYRRFDTAECLTRAQKRGAGKAWHSVLQVVSVLIT